MAGPGAARGAVDRHRLRVGAQDERVHGDHVAAVRLSTVPVQRMVLGVPAALRVDVEDRAVLVDGGPGVRGAALPAGHQERHRAVPAVEQALVQRGEAGVDDLPRGGGGRSGRRISGQRLEPATGQVLGPAGPVVLAVQRAVRVAVRVRVERARRRDPRAAVHPRLVERQDAVEAVDRPRRVGGRAAVVGQAEPRAAPDIGGTQDAPFRVARHGPFEVALVQRERHAQATAPAVRPGAVDRGRLARPGQRRGRAALEVAGGERADVVVDALPERVRGDSDERRPMPAFADRVDAVAQLERPLLGLVRQGAPLRGPLALVVALADKGVRRVRRRLVAPFARLAGQVLDRQVAPVLLVELALRAGVVRVSGAFQPLQLRRRVDGRPRRRGGVAVGQHGR